MESKYISLSNFKKLLIELSETNEVFAPHLSRTSQIVRDDFIYYKKVTKDSADTVVFNGPRSHDSLKPLFFKSKEKVSTYFPSEKEFNPPFEEKIIVAAKACDVAAISAQDKFFSMDPADPFYILNRQNSLIIGSDCADAWQSCFCTLVKLQPYPKNGFDLNVSQTEEGLVVEIGSQKGDDFIARNAHYFGTASKEVVEMRNQARQRMTEYVQKINQQFTLKDTLQDILRATIRDKMAWKKLVKACTECSACNRICPTCSCFLLYDQTTSTKAERIKVWDHCMHCAYGKVAGGANPRPELGERYQNRLHCKFDYMLEQIAAYTCTGCGRCIEVCMAKIDMRECLQEMQGRAALSAKLE